MLKLEDCYGMYRSHVDTLGCDEDCNAWRKVHEMRKQKHGAACVSAYALTRQAAAEFLGYEGLFASLQKHRPWGYAIIEDAVNVLSYGPWKENSYQLIHNPFHQTDGLDNSGTDGSQGGPIQESDNHPLMTILGD